MVMVANNITHRIFKNKTLLIAIAVILLLLELQIFVIFAGKSRTKQTLQVLSESGTVIYETNGTDLTQFKKYYFEETFGPFENYEKKLVTRTEPFQFRGWFVAAIGVPLGFTLLLAFIISSFSALFGKQHPADDTPEGSPPENKSRLDQFFGQISRMNIFMVGTAVFLVVVAFWVLPNLISFVGQTGLEIIDRYRWFFAAAAVAVLMLFSWVIYLRYLLARRTLEAEIRLREREQELRLEALPGPAPSSVLKLENKSGPASSDAALSTPDLSDSSSSTPSSVSTIYNQADSQIDTQVDKD